MATVIFLHGTSSSGKTSIAKKIQELYQPPLLLAGIDTLIDMLPDDLVGHDEQSESGYHFEMKDGFVERVALGEYAKKLVQCSVPVVSMLLGCGNNIIVDEILFKGEERDFLAAYAHAFAGHTAYFIKIDCPLEVLEEREIARKNRHRGIARLQYNHIHDHGFEYDFTIDTSTCQVEACAQHILDYIAQEQAPRAFEVIRAATLPKSNLKICN